MSFPIHHILIYVVILHGQSCTLSITSSYIIDTHSVCRIKTSPYSAPTNSSLIQTMPFHTWKKKVFISNMYHGGKAGNQEGQGTWYHQLWNICHHSRTQMLELLENVPSCQCYSSSSDIMHPLYTCTMKTLCTFYYIYICCNNVVTCNNTMILVCIATLVPLNIFN